MTSPQAWEMGSEFHYPVDRILAPTARDSAAFQGELHVSGRAALRSLIAELEAGDRVFWAPKYICPDVSDTLSELAEIRWYDDYPDEPSPRFDTLEAAHGDYVLVQETFGLSNVAQWADWSTAHPEVNLIEDITHDCTYERYLRSPAEHVFASLRKSLPVPDGGIIFSRDGGLRRCSSPTSPGAYLKLEAMLQKQMYLRGLRVNKQAFRQLQVQGESELGKTLSGSCLSHTEQLLQVLPLGELRSTWAQNNARLTGNLNSSQSGAAMALPSRSHSPGMFHTVLKCADQSTRDRLRAHLVRHSIYSAVHWLPTSKSSTPSTRAVRLGRTLLTIPTDFRYSGSDIEKLSELILEGMGL